jgi:hypothetical protein
MAAQIKLKGEHDSGTFGTRTEASPGPLTLQKTIIAGKRRGIPDKAFDDLLEKEYLPGPTIKTAST